MSDWRASEVRVCARCRLEISDDEMSHHLGGQWFHGSCKGETLRDARLIALRAARTELDAAIARKEASTIKENDGDDD